MLRKNAEIFGFQTREDISRRKPIGTNSLLIKVQVLLIWIKERRATSCPAITAGIWDWMGGGEEDGGGVVTFPTSPPSRDISQQC